MARRKNKTSIALPPALVRRLDRLARAAESSRTQLIREMIEAGLEQTELMVKASSDPVMMRAIGKVMAEPGFFRQMASSLKTELSDDQLELFRGRLEHMGEAVEGANRAVTLAVRKKVRKK